MSASNNYQTVRQLKNRRASSSTPGKSKGSNCHKSDRKNQYCKDTKMYKKQPDLYADICKEVNSLNGYNG